MALNITEANAVNTLFKVLLDTPVEEIPPYDQIRQAVATLARSAHKTLLAGFTSEAAVAALDRVSAGGN